MKSQATFRIDGYITKAPEPRYRVSGQKLDVLALTVQVEGKDKEKPTNIDCEAWRDARAAVEGLRVGQAVRIEGRFINDPFQTQQGRTYDRIKFFVSACLLHAGGGSGSQSRQAQPARAYERSSYTPPPSGSDPQELGYGSRNSRAAEPSQEEDDDIPF